LEDINTYCVEDALRINIEEGRCLKLQEFYVHKLKPGEEKQIS
jgi:hypothetical protein